MPPINAPAISPPANPGPKPPRHRASAGDGAARAVKPTTAAVATASNAFLMFKTLQFLAELPTGNSGEGFPRGRLR
jgi:hypothetical protein